MNYILQALWARVQRLGMEPLDQVSTKAVRMAMVLPLLFPVDIPEGMETVEAYAQENNLGGNFLAFLGYVRRTWLDGVGPHQISVAGNERRTNNNMESNHNKLLKELGLHPAIYTFLGKGFRINTAINISDRVILLFIWNIF